MNGAPVIEVQGLRKVYRAGPWARRQVEALREVTLSVQAGEIFGLLGPNGAGKTTLIKVLLGIVGKTSGTAQLLGAPAGDRRARRRVGYLPEGHRLPRHLTGNTALEYYGGLSGLPRREIRSRGPALLERVGLASWGDTPLRKYSKGMQQRLGLAQAMLHDPDVLILDEPTDGVDPLGGTEIRAVLRELKSQGKTVFLNSHLLQEIELVCDRVAIMMEGSVRRTGDMADLTTHADEEILLHLVGDESQIRAALAPFKTNAWEAAPREGVHVGLRPDSPRQVDECVDRLRQAGISLRGLTPKRLSLEQAFLDLVSR